MFNRPLKLFLGLWTQLAHEQEKDDQEVLKEKPIISTVKKTKKESSGTTIYDVTRSRIENMYRSHESTCLLKGSPSCQVQKSPSCH